MDFLDTDLGLLNLEDSGYFSMIVTCLVLAIPSGSVGAASEAATSSDEECEVPTSTNSRAKC